MIVTTTYPGPASHSLTMIGLILGLLAHQGSLLYFQGVGGFTVPVGCVYVVVLSPAAVVF